MSIHLGISVTFDGERTKNCAMAVARRGVFCVAMKEKGLLNDKALGYSAASFIIPEPRSSTV